MSLHHSQILLDLRAMQAKRLEFGRIHTSLERMSFQLGVRTAFFAILLGVCSARAEALRGAWVASVYNLNFPSHTGLSAEAQKEQIRRIVDAAARSGLNALMVQVRPEGDALYSSHLEPWSRYLTGVQGEAPGYDPLDYFIRVAREENIAIHAWINPYRAATNASEARAENHVSRELAEAVHRIGTGLWLDPGDPAVREHVVRVVRDIIERYPVAGVILDDYFYPYPSHNFPRGSFPDHTFYARYGEHADIGDWRRENINKLIEELHDTIKEVRPDALFGVSPFGIYTKGSPSVVVTGVDQYRDLYADPVAWLKNRWVDYLSPQLYWRDKSEQSFSALLEWWRSPVANPHAIPIYPSIALDRLGGSFGWPSSEIASQLAIELSTRPRSSGGFVLWNVGSLLENKKGVAAVIARAR
ncbi:MAG TPA: family 10 glycosylhydrolase [Chthoniobacterales bacterium]|nr:family 10 glycosylhydrolase [Chthoniobacterales bacterium]